MPNETPAPVTPAAAPAQIEATPAALITLKDRIEAAKEKASAAPLPGTDVAPTEMPPAPDAAAKVPPAQKTGSALAKLAQEQKRTREAMDRLKAERAESEKRISAQKADLDKQLAELKAFTDAKATAKRFPLKALEQLGITHQMVTEAVLNEGEPTANLEVQQVREEIEKIRQEQTEREKRYADERKRDADDQRKQIQAQEAEALKNFQSQCVAFVSQNAEKYELTNTLDQQHLVFQTIDEVYRLTHAEGKPRILTLEEAADEVEKSLEADLEKATKTKKYTAKQPTTPPVATKQPKPTPKPPAQATTLSNTGSAPSSSNGAQAESWKQRRERVYANLKQ